MFAFKTLERRLIVLLVVPVTLFWLIFGVFGYRFIQGIIFKQWQDIAILRLERAAHQWICGFTGRYNGWRCSPGPGNTRGEGKSSAGF
jgi:choline-glycine betaine transporter